MNGESLNFASHTDGVSEGIEAILRALELIHSPTSNNDTRRNASEFLNNQKNIDGAYRSGFYLAADPGNAAIARHFGLSLIEHTIRQRWLEIPDDQTTQVHQWTLQLAQNVVEADPAYIRNKVAQLWVELAKKSWGLDWLDMDAALLALWNKDLTSKELVLTILENLSEDTFTREDSAAALRGHEFNSALFEIFTPAAQFAGGLQVGTTTIVLRVNEDGWLGRIVVFIQDCVSNSSAKQARICLTKALASLRSVFSWGLLSAIVSTQALQATCTALSVQDTDVLMSAIQVLHTLYDRSHFDDVQYEALICPMYQPESVALLRNLYEWSIVGIEDMDSPKYPISKKLSEVVSFLSDHVEHKPQSVELPDLSTFLRFMISIAENASLMVSIPIMHSWTKMLASRTNLQAVKPIIGPLLEVASRRVFRYEQLSDDSDEPAILFITEDIEAIPERHAFLGNYRRYCFLVVESICCIEPREAIPYVLSTTDKALDELASHSFDPSKYTKTSPTVLQADARLTVVDAALKGYSDWAATGHGSHPQRDESDRNALELMLENWATTMLVNRAGSQESNTSSNGGASAPQTRMAFNDPMFRQRVMKTAVEFSNRALQKKESFALKVLEHLLTSQLPDLPEHPAYSEAVKDLQMYATGELRRLASRHADYFATFYDQLQAKIQEIVATRDLGEKSQAELPAALFIIMQRAKGVDPALRRQRLLSFIEPITQAWEATQLTQSLSTIDNFSEFMALNKVVRYLRARNANQIQDWSDTALDMEGIAIRDEGTERYSQLPLRLTKTILGVSVDKAVKGTHPYQIACDLWSPVIPAVLPNLLKLVSYAHRLHNPDAWPDLPPEMRSIAAKVLQDRFWQAGISGGTMNDFYANIAMTKSSLEGFASATRGKIRTIRETCYNIFYSMSRLGESFYGYEGLPEPLAEALFSSAGFLSAHNFSILLDMGKRLIDDCPASQRRSFLVPVLSTLFRQMDQKCTDEWVALDRRKAATTNGEDLTDEMRAESILRQLCYKSVMLVAALLDPARDQATENRQPLHNTDSDGRFTIDAATGSLRDSLLSELQILEPLLLFCSHAMTFRDTRSCAVIVRTVRSIVPHFASADSIHDPTAAAIREFVATEVLKAAITSLHDGYFVDVQKDLAALIGTIWVAYGLPTHVAAEVREEQNGDDGPPMQPAHDRPPLTQSVRNLFLGLPGMSEQRVDGVAGKLAMTGGVGGQHRQQRALVLGLMEGLRGVRISELGNFDRDDAKERSKLQEKYMRRESMGMKVEEPGTGKVDVEGEGLDELGAVAGLFG